MPSSRDAQRLRRAQAGIRTLVERDLARFFASLNLNRPEAARNALLEFVPALVDTYGQSAAAVAADWYDEARAAEGVPGRFRARMVVPDETEATRVTVRRAAGALFTPTPGDALVAITAKVTKYALAGSRQTIAESTFLDPQASGWQRVTRANSCEFCRMLAGRGAVYKQATVDFAAHGDCNCAAVPSWDQDAPEVDVRLYVASQRTTSMSPQQKAAHNDLIRRAIDEYVL